MRRLGLVVLAGCSSYSAVPLAVHPTATANERSVGVAVGGTYGKQVGGTSVLAVPHGEGWIRVPVAPGQVGVHIAPDIVSAGYRYDIVAGSMVIGIEPRIGGAYARTLQPSSGPMDPEEKDSSVTLTGGVIATFLFPAGAGFAYVTPKFGFEDAFNLDADPGERDSTKLYVLGLSLGVDLGGGTSIELAVHRVDDAEEEMVDTKPIWLVVPTLGLRR